MKKFILPIYFFLLFLLFPVRIDAQSSSDCWSTHMIRQYATCSDPHLKCLNECSRLDTTPKRKVCFEECGRVNKLCTDKAVADYRACVRGGTQTSDLKEENQTQPSQEPVPTTQQKTISPVQDLKDDKEDKPLFKFPVFINEWFKITSDLIRMQLGISGFVDMWVEHESPVDWPKTYLKKDPNDLSDMPKPWPDVQIKLSQQNNRLSLKQEDSIPPGSTISGAEPFKIDSENGVTLVPGTSGQTTIKTPDSTGYYYLQEGSVEVLKQPDSGEGTIFGIETPIGTVTVVHTHFFVSYDKKTSEMTVIVYDGKVEVKTKDGKKTTVSPDGDRPGVVVVSQKLSPIKLGITGVVLASVIGGAALILKRKFAAKESIKKKK